MGSWEIDEGGDPYLFAGGRDVFAVEEGAGPVFDGFIVWNLWISVTLATVECCTTASCQFPASYGLSALQEAVLEVSYRRGYA